MTTRDTSQQPIELNEDCLALNTWTPEPDDDRRPVTVWFHGRRFCAGAGSEHLYDGANLASRGDVVVTVNHRLSVFGYLQFGAVDPAVGSNRVEYALYEIANPNFGEMTMDGLRRKLGTRLGNGFDEVVAVYSASRGTDAPWQLYIAIQGNYFQQGTNLVASVHSDAAPVFLYSFDYPVTRKLGACQGAKIAYVYANATEATGSSQKRQL